MSGTTHNSPRSGHGPRQPRRYRSGMRPTVSRLGNTSPHFLKAWGSTSKEKQARRAARLAR